MRILFGVGKKDMTKKDKKKLHDFIKVIIRTGRRKKLSSVYLFRAIFIESKRRMKDDHLWALVYFRCIRLVVCASKEISGS